MNRFVSGMIMLALGGCVSLSQGDAHAAIQVAPSSITEPISQLLNSRGFDGAISIEGGRLDGFARNAGGIWPWASITKQVMATLVMQDVEAGRLALDVPVNVYLEDWPESPLPAPSLRQLLQHQSGLYDPESDPDFDWEDASPVDPMMCVRRRVDAPGGGFSYINCDTLLVGRVLERVNATPLPDLLSERITGPLGMRNTGFATPDVTLAGDGRGTPAAEIAGYGASGGLVGTTADLLRFSRALLDGELLGREALAEMWTGNPALGYIALAQWEFEAGLRNCNAPVRIVERRGAIGGYQARHFIMPQSGIAVVAFIDESEEDYDFGEIWSGAGLSYEILSEAVCGVN